MASSDTVDWSASPIDDSATHRSNTGYVDEELFRVLSKAVEELNLEWSSMWNQNAADWTSRSSSLATDLTLRATNVTAQFIGHTMGSLVVLDCH